MQRLPAMLNDLYTPRRLLQVGVANQLFSAAIGVGFWLNGFPGFWLNIAVSLLIGNTVWLGVDGGRLLVGRWLQRRTGRVLPWPGWRWMAPVIILAAMGGYTLGGLLAHWLFGIALAPMGGKRSTAVVTGAAGFAATALWYARETLQKHRAEAEAARRQAAENQLRLLQSQLEPHMLFNTLANLRVLIGLDPARAQEMLDRLIGFLRSTLGASRATLHPLQAEFDRTADYLALMAVRMGARLAVELDLPADLAAQPVPPLLLQPLVENAIQHGLEPKIEGGRIVVQARRQADRLVLTVRDTGLGLPASPQPAQADRGFGTPQVRERLATLYGDAASFTLAPAADEDGGTLATLSLPLVAPTPGTRIGTPTGDAR